MAFEVIKNRIHEAMPSKTIKITKWNIRLSSDLTTGKKYAVLYRDIENDKLGLKLEAEKVENAYKITSLNSITLGKLKKYVKTGTYSVTFEHGLIVLNDALL